MIKVMIADDQELIRQSLEIVLSTKPGIEVVSTVADGFEVLESIKKCRPDLILMDIRMPKMDGVYCTKMVKEQYPDICQSKNKYLYGTSGFGTLSDGFQLYHFSREGR